MDTRNEFDGLDQAGLIERLIEPSIADSGYELVRVQFTGGGQRTLQVMIERKDRAPMTVDDCAGVSRLVSALLDVEDPVPGSYNLEVSSPGIDRPLVRLADFERFAGFEARIELTEPVDGRRKYLGTLDGVENELVTIVCAGAPAQVPFGRIRRASLVLTDELMEAATREIAAAESEG